MRKIIAFNHISLDGFVSGPKGEMDWIKINEEIFDHVGRRISQTDTALYGRTTFQMMENYWPTAADKPNASKHDIEHSKWYSESKKLVISTTLKEDNFKNTKILGGNFKEELNEIRQQQGSEILVFGSPTATHSLIQENLIDGYWLFVNPIILGEGIPLFKNIKERTKLNLLNSKQFKCGVIELDYILD